MKPSASPSPRRYKVPGAKTNLDIASDMPEPLAFRLNLKRLLVPTDFSEVSRHALRYALPLAEQFNIALTLLYVVPTHVPAELAHLGVVLEERRLEAEAKKALAAFRAKEIPASLQVQTIVLSGGASHEICRAARALACDLIVLSTHGRTGLRHVLLGSTAERVVRHAPCPVLTVRPRPMEIRFPEDAQAAFRRILVPTDFSKTSRKALRYGASLADEFGASLDLLHVIEPPPYPEFGYAHMAIKSRRLAQAARERLSRLRAEAGIHTRLVRSTRVRTGRAAHEICQEATERDIELIALSTHGFTGLKHVLLGSTAERVVRHAPCPVLVVRQREREFVTGERSSR